MDTNHIILETDSISQMQEILNSNARNGYKVVSLNPYYDAIMGKTYYTALIVKYSGVDSNANSK